MTANFFHRIPGWFFLAFIGLGATAISEMVIVGGKHPLEASVLAIIFGLLISTRFGVADLLRPGVKASENLLIWGIILMGAALNFSTVASVGAEIFAVILITMTIGMLVILGLGSLMKLNLRLSILLAAGTTICGTSAIAIVAPLIKSKQEETSYAVATVALFGLLAILLYPLLGRMVEASDLQFGVFAGTAIHSTPQVVGAGFMFSDEAGRIATTVKLVRNCFMAPLAILIGLWFMRRESSTERTKIDFLRAFPWFLFGYFFMAFLGTGGVITPVWIEHFSQAGKFLILLAMAGIGLNTSISSFKHVGMTPLLVGLGGAIVVALISAASILLLI